jgi:hypothetical protein
LNLQDHNGSQDLTDLDIDLLFPSITNYLDGAVFLLLIECAELSLLLPVVEGTDEDDNNDGDDDGDAFHEVDTRRCTELCGVVGTGFLFVLHTDVLIDTEGQGNYCSDTQ